MTDKWIWLDMDGTIADLYGVDGWLEDKVRSIQIDNLVKYIGIEERKDEIDV